MVEDNSLTRSQKKEVDKQVDAKVKEAVKTELDKKVDKQVKKRLASVAFEKVGVFGGEFKKHASTAMIAALSFIVALAWKDLIVNLVDKITKPLTGASSIYLAQLISAVVVTVIAVVGIALVSRWAKTKDKK